MVRLNRIITDIDQKLWGKFSMKRPSRREFPNIRKLLLTIVIVTFLAGILSLSVYFLIPALPANRLAPSEKTFIQIPRGMPFTRIADTLITEGLVDSYKRFYWSARFMKRVERLQAGTFEIPGGLSYRQLINLLSAAPPLQVRVTIPEGLEFEEIAGIFSRRFGFDIQDFLSYKDSVHLFNLPFQAISLEGYLYPETYDFYENADPREIISRMVRQFLYVINQEIQDEIHEKGLTVHTIVTLASIIQGEAIIHEEMPVISSVYQNRLKRKMRLQADPTIQYLIPGPKIRLRARHLEIDSPYNTYKYRGLPPGPVNSPGKDAILAALRPDTTDYLYFVARGDGSHVFSKTHREHLKAKQNFQQVRWEVYRQQKLRQSQTP